MTELIKLEACICSSVMCMYKLLYIFLEISTSDVHTFFRNLKLCNTFAIRAFYKEDEPSHSSETTI